jgi:hypothetical protein
MSDTSLETNIPSGSWTLYFHSPEESKWTLNTFINFGSMSTWGDFWNVMNKLKVSTIADGMFFLMRNPIPPLWENFQNIRGGSYSFRLDKRDAGDGFINYAIALMVNKLATDPANIMNGMSITPKKNFNILKVWNTDATKYNKAEDIVMTTGDMLYTPFIEKKM